MTVLGVILAIVVDVLLPLGLVALILRRVRHWGRGYWIGTGVYLGIVTLAVWSGLAMSPDSRVEASSRRRSRRCLPALSLPS